MPSIEYCQVVMVPELPVKSNGPLLELAQIVDPPVTVPGTPGGFKVIDIGDDVATAQVPL